MGFLWNPRYLNSSSIGNDLERGSYIGNSNQICTEVDPTTRGQKKVGEIHPQKTGKHGWSSNLNFTSSFFFRPEKMVARNPTCLNRSLTKATKHRGFYQFGAEAELLARFLSEVNRRILQSPEELLTYEDSEVESETNMEYMDYTP